MIPADDFYMNSLKVLKIVAAVATVVGLSFGFFEQLFKPHVLLLESSPSYPRWLAWLGYSVTALGALAYIAIDLLSHFCRRDD